MDTEMISKIEGNRYYIATMIPATDENYDRTTCVMKGSALNGGQTTEF